MKRLSLLRVLIASSLFLAGTLPRGEPTGGHNDRITGGQRRRGRCSPNGRLYAVIGLEPCLLVGNTRDPHHSSDLDAASTRGGALFAKLDVEGAQDLIARGKARPPDGDARNAQPTRYSVGVYRPAKVVMRWFGGRHGERNDRERCTRNTDRRFATSSRV